jgi:hypothetical protein
MFAQTASRSRRGPDISRGNAAHAFRSQCVREELERHLDEVGDDERAVLVHALVALLHDADHGICMRCQGPLRSEAGEPVGSRVRTCRCIPICVRCGQMEEREDAVGALTSVFDWYRDREVRDEVERDLRRAAGVDRAGLEPAT